MRLMCVALLLMSSAKPVYPQTASDPFRGVYQQDDSKGGVNVQGTAHERAAVRTLTLSNKGMPLWVTTRSVGRERVVFVRGWSRSGTGFGQITDYVFTVGADGAISPAWRVLVEEYSTPFPQSSEDEQPRYSFYGCLFIVGDHMAYLHGLIPKKLAGGASLVPKTGAYGINGDRLGDLSKAEFESASTQCSSRSNDPHSEHLEETDP
jgi:hypothetical protein